MPRRPSQDRKILRLRRHRHLRRRILRPVLLIRPRHLLLATRTRVPLALRLFVISENPLLWRLHRRLMVMCHLHSVFTLPQLPLVHPVLLVVEVVLLLLLDLLLLPRLGLLSHLVPFLHLVAALLLAALNLDTEIILKASIGVSTVSTLTKSMR